MSWSARLSRHERGLVAGMLVLGFFVRLAWLFLRPTERLIPAKSEMWHVAATFAASGRFADAYAPGSGLSSHVGPFNTAVEGLVYRAFGIGSLPAEVVLAVIAAVTACTLFWLLYRVAGELGIGLVPRLAALALLVFVPFNFWVEMVDFRIREGAFAAAIATALLWWLLRLDAAGGRQGLNAAGRRQGLNATPTTFDRRSQLCFALAAGFAFLINPGVALGAYAGLGCVALRHLPPRRWLPLAGVLALGFVMVNGAWIARNATVYHRLMISRGNFGLELDIAYADSVVAPTDARAAWHARMADIHPFFSPTALARLKTFPDDASYFAALGHEATGWIAAHPAAAARLTLRHLRELYFPPPWLFDPYESGMRGIGLKLTFLWTLTALGLAGLLLGLRQRPRQYLFVALTLAFPTALYSLVQPTLRYRYAFAGLLTFFAAAFVWRLAELVLSSPRKRGPMTSDI